MVSKESWNHVELKFSENAARLCTILDWSTFTGSKYFIEIEGNRLAIWWYVHCMKQDLLTSCKSWLISGSFWYIWSWGSIIAWSWCNLVPKFVVNYYRIYNKLIYWSLTYIIHPFLHINIICVCSYTRCNVTIIWNCGHLASFAI